MLLCSAALIGVLGATGTCELAFRLSDRCLYLCIRHTHPRNRETSTYASLPLVLFFTMCLGFHNRVCTLFPLLKEQFDVTDPSMITFKIPPVIPTRILWLVMLLLISIFGLIAQVRPSTQQPLPFLI